MLIAIYTMHNMRIHSDRHSATLRAGRWCAALCFL